FSRSLPQPGVLDVVGLGDRRRNPAVDVSGGFVREAVEISYLFDLLESRSLPFAVNERLINDRAQPPAQTPAPGIVRELAQPLVAVQPHAVKLAEDELGQVFALGLVFGQSPSRALHRVAIFRVEGAPGRFIAFFASDGQAQFTGSQV